MTFRLSASGRTITHFTTTRSPRPTMYSARTTIVTGHVDRRRRTAWGTIYLGSISTPSNPLSPVSATFTARAER